MSKLANHTTSLPSRHAGPKNDGATNTVIVTVPLPVPLCGTIVYEWLLPLTLLGPRNDHVTFEGAVIVNVCLADPPWQLLMLKGGEASAALRGWISTLALGGTGLASSVTDGPV